MEVHFGTQSLLLLTLNVLFLVISSSSVNSTTVLMFSPPTGVLLTVDEIIKVTVTGKTSMVNLNTISVRVMDGTIAKISGNSSVLLQHMDCVEFNETGNDDFPLISQGHCFNFSFTVQGIFLGRSDVEFNADYSILFGIRYSVSVLRPYDIVRDIYIYILMVLVALNTIGFGCTIDLSEIRKIMKKPIAPAIGLGCQFILNPLLSYGLGKTFGISLSLALGLFSIGSCPGGGSSNRWTYLLDGDLNLSILMTFIGTIVSFGTLPLWMYTLGKTITPKNVLIPFANIFYTLLGLVIPCILGFLIKRFSTKAAKYIRKFIKPFALLSALLSLSLGIYTNLYMFTILQNWRVLLCGGLFPYLSFVISAIIAWISRQTPARILTISIETAVQNTSIAIVIILTAFPQPEADIAAVMPVIAVVFTPLPLLIMFVIKTIRKRCKKPNAKDEDTSTTEGTVTMGTYTKHHESDEKYDNVTFIITSGESKKVPNENSEKL